MNPSVIDQIAGLRERLVTNITDIRLIARVTPEVNLQVALRVKHLRANAAGERIVHIPGDAVVFQQVRFHPPEIFFTNRTFFQRRRFPFGVCVARTFRLEFRYQSDFVPRRSRVRFYFDLWLLFCHRYHRNFRADRFY